jgi:glycosyltransferase involved in cell wall biosynthesis
MRRPRLVYVATHAVTADLLLRGQLAFMREQGFDVTVIAAPGPDLDRVRERERVETVAVPMVRANDAVRDAVSLTALTRALARIRPDIVNAGTPKAGLLGMLAARALRVPIRIYLLRGLRLETTTGLLRAVLATTEKIASGCANDVVCNSPSLLRAAVDGGYVPARKARVIGHGSSNGVDTERYRPTDELRRRGSELTTALGIPDGAPLVAFVGRFAADKGMAELLDAHDIVRTAIPETRLALLGGDLADEAADPKLAERARRTPGVVTTPRIFDLAPYYARMNVLAFPSFREGFPNVIVEAAAAETPTVGFRSTGVVDGVVSGETGTLVAQGDAKALAEAILQYLHSPELARAHGRAARQRAVRHFERRNVWIAWLEAYRVSLRARSLPLPETQGVSSSAQH